MEGLAETVWVDGDTVGLVDGVLDRVVVLPRDIVGLTEGLTPEGLTEGLPVYDDRVMVAEPDSLLVRVAEGPGEQVSVNEGLWVGLPRDTLGLPVRVHVAVAVRDRGTEADSDELMENEPVGLKD